MKTLDINEKSQKNQGGSVTKFIIIQLLKSLEHLNLILKQCFDTSSFIQRI